MYKPLNIAEKIKLRAKEKRVSLKIMLSDLSLGSNTMSNMRHDRMIAADSLARIADYLDCSVDYLLGRTDVPELQRSAGERPGLFSGSDINQVNTGKGLLAQAEEVKALEAAARPEEIVYYVISGFFQPMSAGTGAEAGDDEPEDFMLTKRPPRGASYVAPVSGDSMEPTFHDGDQLFIHACDQIEPGRIGVFLMDGKQWVKELGDGVLISHNPAYEPVPITPDIRCQGLVLGVCDASYFG